MSFKALGAPYHMVQVLLGTAGFGKEDYCGHIMVQYAPFWVKELYGEYPKGYKETSQPKILFLHTNQFKYEALSNPEKYFEVLKHYSKPSFTALFPYNYCIRIASLEDNPVTTHLFKEIFPDFHENAKEITGLISKHFD